MSGDRATRPLPVRHRNAEANSVAMKPFDELLHQVKSSKGGLLRVCKGGALIGVTKEGKPWKWLWYLLIPKRGVKTKWERLAQLDLDIKDPSPADVLEVVTCFLVRLEGRFFLF